MHNGSLFYALFDRYNLVYGGRCDGLFLDDGLYGLMYMVFYALSCDGTVVLLGPLDWRDMLDVLVLGPHRLKLLAVFRKHVGLTLADDLWEDVVLVLGGLHLVRLNWLYAMLVVMDVALPGDGLGDLDLLDWLDVLLNDGRSGLRADLGGVSLVVGLEEVLDVVHGWD